MSAPSIDAKAVFKVAASIESPEARRDYLNQVCGDDHELRNRVVRLLRMDEEEPSFLESPLVGGDPTLDFKPIAERPGTKIGPYKLQQEIGEGGMGIVYMAHQREPVRRKVALKIIKPGMDTREVMHRFEAERQALAMMDHPNIAKVLEAGTTESGRPYFVMELVNGPPITEFADDNNMTTRQRLELFNLVCNAVQHAHQKGIIHRDLKPSNILVTLHDGVPVPKIIDFGIAKAINQELSSNTVLTGLGQMVGTPMYMSPEQAERSGLDVDTRSDIYSLGVLLYELLTGTTPFDKEQLKAAGLDEVRRLIREQEPDRPSTRVSTMGKAATTLSEHRKTNPVELSNTLRHEIDWIVVKAMDKDRTRRYETATDFVRDIQRYLNDEPVEACPPSRVYRMRKFARRNKTSVLTTVAVSLALIFGSGIATWQAVRAIGAEETANEQLEIAREQKRLAKRQEKLARDAEQREKNLRKEADAARKRAEAATDYLVEIFRSPDPERDGRTVTVAEVLDRLVKRLEVDSDDDPLLRARLLQATGDTFLSLGNPNDAAKLIEEARTLRTEALGPEHQDTKQSTVQLIRAYSYGGGMLDQALQLAQQTVTTWQKAYGPRDPNTLAAMSELASVHIQRGNKVAGIKLLEKILPIYRETLGTAHKTTLSTMSILASAHWYLRYVRDTKYDARLQQEVLKLSCESLGPEHPLTLDAMQGVTGWLTHEGKYNDAIELGRETLQLYRKVHGDDDPGTLLAINSLAVALGRAGYWAEAAKLSEEAFQCWLQKFGRKHPYTHGSMMNYAKSLELGGFPERAIEILEECVRNAPAELEPPHHHNFEAVAMLSRLQFHANNEKRAKELLAEALARVPHVSGFPNCLGAVELADALNGAGQRSEALSILQEMVEIWTREGGGNLRPSLGECAVLHAEAGNAKEAVRLFNEVLALQKSVFADHHPKTLETMIQLATVLIGEGNCADAEPLLLEAQQGFARRNETDSTPYDHTQTRKTLTLLIQLYEKWNQPEKARTWKEKLDALKAEEKKSNGND